ncbi:MAG: triose-phosphate isomerase family protein [Thermomicrobiales bacterium]
MNDHFSRRLTIGTNLKMHQTPAETAAFVEALPTPLEPVVRGRDDVQLFVIPPFTSISAADAAREPSLLPLWIGGQNMHWAEEGAFTGEISARMLTGAGADLVLLGHAERRGLFGETDDALARKVPAALAAELRVLLAVGETSDERAWGVGPETVSRQLKIALIDVDPGSASRISVAYEPVWSIGSDGIPAEPGDVEPMATTIRATLADLFGAASEQIPVLYGGSVNGKNCGDFMALNDIDGLFVGRAAWTVEGFAEIVQAAIQ